MDEHSPGDYTESQLYGMITDIYSYVRFPIGPSSYDKHLFRFLFLDADPSKAMLLEERVKEHIKDLQRNIKANILEDVGGKVRHVISQRGSLFT